MKSTAIAVLSALVSVVTQAKAPYIDPALDRKYLGNSQSELFWTPHEKVAGFRNQHLIFPVRTVSRGEQLHPLPENLKDLSSINFSAGEKQLTLEGYFTDYNTAGLLVIKDGFIVYERYELGNDRNTLWNSFSVTKSITSMLLGAAIKDGYIMSLDEYVTDYLHQLKGSNYEGVTIRHILTMTSGVSWDETYSDPESDINNVPWSSPSFYKYLQSKNRLSEPGTTYTYSTAETNLVGDLLRSAIGDNLSTYLSDKIWRPFGMEKDANWELTGTDENEFGGSSLSATLRDYGRLGLFALNGGVLANGKQVLADGWMAQSLTPSAANPRHGYQWWLGRDGVYEASGIFGQSIYVDPKRNVVIAQHSARSQANNPEDWAVQAAAFRALAKAVSD